MAVKRVQFKLQLQKIALPLINLLKFHNTARLTLLPDGLLRHATGYCIERINEIKKGEEDDISKY